MGNEVCVTTVSIAQACTNMRTYVHPKSMWLLHPSTQVQQEGRKGGGRMRKGEKPQIRTFLRKKWCGGFAYICEFHAPAQDGTRMTTDTPMAANRISSATWKGGSCFF